MSETSSRDRGMGKYLRTDQNEQATSATNANDEPTPLRRTNEAMQQAHDRAAIEANPGLGKYLLPQDHG